MSDELDHRIYFLKTNTVRCPVCNSWPTYCKCMTQAAQIALAKLLAQEVKRWTNEASREGGLMRTAEQAQLHCLDLAARAQQQLLDVLTSNFVTDDTGSKSKTEDR
jgi:hypothetical protein